MTLASGVGQRRRASRIDDHGSAHAWVFPDPRVFGPLTGSVSGPGGRPPTPLHGHRVMRYNRLTLGARAPLAGFDPLTTGRFSRVH